MMSSKSQSSRSTTLRPRQPTKEKEAVLCLTLHREFFDAILSGKKKTEYRDNKEYWRRRLVGRTYREIHFRNGYATKAPFMRVEFKGLRKHGSGRGSYFAIRLGKVLELKHYRSR
ncbi:MAG: ASCH domain-containing protein [Nitrospira defluvii]|nr:ASCH domain-containing protein [Nitrospira defluvii]